MYAFVFKGTTTVIFNDGEKYGVGKKDHLKGWKNELPYVSIGKRVEGNGDMSITFSLF